MWTLIGVWTLTAACAMAYESIQLSDEKRLIKHLLENYERVGVVGRPVYNTSETVRVSYGLALIQILDLDEKNQVLTTNVWNRYLWNDILLKWNPEDFGGVDHVRVPADKIWTPDIVLYNYADTRLKEQRDAMAVVSSDGNVLWIPPSIFKSTCSIDILHFPFDTQKCKMKFGSWTYDGFKLDVSFYDNIEEIDVTDYIISNEWQLVEHPARKNVKYYPCCEEPYPDLTFYMTLRRIAAFYNYILILPCVLLSSLTLVIFWLPPESPAKMMLGMNLFVAFFVLLLLLADSTPQASATVPLIGMNIFVAFFLLLLLLADSTPPAVSSVPLIGAYFCLNMILITLSTFLSVIVINLYFRGDKKSKVPPWLKRTWKDILLQWDVEEFGGVEEVRVPASKIWTPDIVLYNYADVRLKEQRDALAVISSNGQVLWIPTSIYKSTCSIDILFFPYDQQTCHLKFGSWTYDGYKLDVDFYDDADRVDITDYIPSNEWYLVSSPARKNIKYYPCCHEPYPDLTFTISVKRSSIFHSYIIVLPCVLLSSLTLVIFWIPPESTAKMILGMNIFVAFFLLLRILADSTPPASESVPLLGAFFCLNMVLITLSSYISVVVINIYSRVDKKNKVPPWLRKIAVDGMARLFCMRYAIINTQRSRQEHVTYTMEMGRRKEKRKIKSPVLKHNKFDNANDYRNSPIVTRNHTPDRSPVFQQSLEQDIKDIKRAFRQFQNRINEREAAARVNLEWRVVATVLDKLFFFIYLATICVSLGTIFPWI